MYQDVGTLANLLRQVKVLPDTYGMIFNQRALFQERNPSQGKTKVFLWIPVLICVPNIEMEESKCRNTLFMLCRVTAYYYSQKHVQVMELTLIFNFSLIIFLDTSAKWLQLIVLNTLANVVFLKNLIEHSTTCLGPLTKAAFVTWLLQAKVAKQLIWQKLSVISQNGSLV